jgi:Na+-transporting NADH:ubiquinone oxidoreductase subunit NqrD
VSSRNAIHYDHPPLAAPSSSFIVAIFLVVRQSCNHIFRQDYLKMQVFFGVVTTLCLVSPFVESFSAMPKAMPKYNDGTEYAMKYTDINNILKQNREYVASMGQEFFDDLGSKHQPKYMWIGCADARAPANEIMV